MKKASSRSLTGLISPFIKKSISGLYALTVLYMAPFILNFIWGNHDWQWVKEYTPLWSGVFEGRFSQFFLPFILTEGNIFPVLTLLIALLFDTAAAILLLKLLGVPQKIHFYILGGLVLTTAPYTLSWFYFAFLTLSCLSWIFIIAAGFWLMLKSTFSPLIKYLVSFMLFVLALGGYPPVINTIGVLFFALFLTDLCLNNIPLKTLIKKYMTVGLTITASTITFLLILMTLKKLNLSYDTYNTNGITPADIPPKITYAFLISLKQFITPTDFIGIYYKTIMLILSLLGIGYLFKNLQKNSLSLLLFVSALIGMLFSSVLTVFSAADVIFAAHEPRIEFFGLLFIYFFLTAVLLRIQKTCVRNLISCLLLGTAILNFNTVAYAAKIWKLGFKAEENLNSRIVNRIEESPVFNINKTYTFIQGGSLNFRRRFTLPTSVKRKDSYTVDAPYIPWHLPSKAYKFYYPKDIFGKDFDIFWSYVDVHAVNMTDALYDYLTETSWPWPHLKAIFTDDDIIVLTLTPKGKQQAADWVNTYFENYPHNR